MQQNRSQQVEPDVYTPQEIAVILKISRRKAYALCNDAKDFKVKRIGKNVRVLKDSFDAWLAR